MDEEENPYETIPDSMSTFPRDGTNLIHSEVFEITPIASYDPNLAKLRASLEWLLARAYGSDVPQSLRDPLCDGNQSPGSSPGGGSVALRPAVADALLSGRLYARLASRIFPDLPAKTWSAAAARTASLTTPPVALRHAPVLSALLRHGFDLVDDTGEQVSVESLADPAFRYESHIAVMDGLMGLVTYRLLPLDRVNAAIRMHSGSYGPPLAPPSDIDSALLAWINAVCDKVRRRLSQTSAFVIPVMDDLLTDISDGCCLAVLLHHYCPDLLRLTQIALSENVGIADSCYNLRLVQSLCERHVTSESDAPVWHLSTEDWLYMHSSVRDNVLVFLAELFHFFEGDPPPPQRKRLGTAVVVPSPPPVPKRSATSVGPVSDVTRASLLRHDEHVRMSSAASEPDLSGFAPSGGVSRLLGRRRASNIGDASHGGSSERLAAPRSSVRSAWQGGDKPVSPVARRCLDGGDGPARRWLPDADDFDRDLEDIRRAARLSEDDEEEIRSSMSPPRHTPSPIRIRMKSLPQDFVQPPLRYRWVVYVVANTTHRPTTSFADPVSARHLVHELSAHSPLRPAASATRHCIERDLAPPVNAERLQPAITRPNKESLQLEEKARGRHTPSSSSWDGSDGERFLSVTDEDDVLSPRRAVPPVSVSYSVSPQTAREALAHGLPVVSPPSEIEEDLYRHNKVARALQQESNKLARDEWVRETRPEAGDDNWILRRPSRRSSSDDGYERPIDLPGDSADHRGGTHRDEHLARPNLSSFAELRGQRPPGEQQQSTTDDGGGKSLSLREQYMRSKKDKGKKATFAALPNQTTWKEATARSGADNAVMSKSADAGPAKSQLIDALMTGSVLVGQAKAELEADTSDIVAVKLRLEERRRQIEAEKRRLEERASRQRQKVGEAAFKQVLNIKPQSTSTSATAMTPVADAMTSSSTVADGITSSSFAMADAMTSPLPQTTYTRAEVEEMLRQAEAKLAETDSIRTKPTSQSSEPCRVASSDASPALATRTASDSSPHGTTRPDPARPGSNPSARPGSDPSLPEEDYNAALDRFATMTNDIQAQIMRLSLRQPSPSSSRRSQEQMQAQLATQPAPQPQQSQPQLQPPQLQTQPQFQSHPGLQMGQALSTSQLNLMNNFSTPNYNYPNNNNNYHNAQLQQLASTLTPAQLHQYQTILQQQQQQPSFYSNNQHYQPPPQHFHSTPYYDQFAPVNFGSNTSLIGSIMSPSTFNTIGTSAGHAMMAGMAHNSGGGSSLGPAAGLRLNSSQYTPPPAPPDVSPPLPTTRRESPTTASSESTLRDEAIEVLSRRAATAFVVDFDQPSDVMSKESVEGPRAASKERSNGTRSASKERSNEPHASSKERANEPRATSNERSNEPRSISRERSNEPTEPADTTGFFLALEPDAKPKRSKPRLSSQRNEKAERSAESKPPQAAASPDLPVVVAEPPRPAKAPVPPGDAFVVDLSETASDLTMTTTTTGSDVSGSAFDSSSSQPSEQDLEARRRDKLIAMETKRREEMERKRLARDADSVQRNDDTLRKEAAAEARRAEKEAKRRAIFAQYQQRKAAEQALLDGGEVTGQAPPQASVKAAAKASAVKKRQKAKDAMLNRPQSFHETNPAAHPTGPMYTSHHEGTMTNGSVTHRLNGPPASLTARLESQTASSSDLTGSTATLNDAAAPARAAYRAKSNRNLTQNAISHCCLAGAVNAQAMNDVLAAIERSEAKHFLILFRDASCKYRALYEYHPESESVVKLCGVGPKQLTNAMVHKFYKYNCGSKSFSEIQSTKHVSVSIDAVAILPHLWPSSKKAPVGSKK